MCRANMSPTDIAEMIEISLDDFSIFCGNEWIVFDADAQTIKSDFDLLYMLSDYEDEITDALEDDESLLEWYQTPVITMGVFILEKHLTIRL